MLFLDLGGLELQMRINKFREDLPGEAEYDNPCFLDFAVMRNGANIYHPCKNLPWLTCDEIKTIRDTIKGIIDGRITEFIRLDFLEHDICFEFVFRDGKFSCAYMSLGYWETDGRAVLTGNGLVLCFGRPDLERLMCYLQFKTGADYDKALFDKYCAEGSIKKEPDKLSFRVIDGEVAANLVREDYRGVVGMFINDREILDIVAEIENAERKNGSMGYIHQGAEELYKKFYPSDPWDEDFYEEDGTPILSCVCGIVEDGSPTVFIEKDERYVYWKALGHNQIFKKNYYFPIRYVFDRKQYDAALADLKKFAEDKTIY